MLDKAPNGKVSDLLSAFDKALSTGDVESGVNDGRNRFDFSAKFLLDFIHVESILVCDQIDGQSQMTVPTLNHHTLSLAVDERGMMNEGVANGEW